MMRSLYRGILWLHPPSFEEHFAEEMLWIFDQRSEAEIGAALLLDCFVSLCRQRIVRSGLWTFGVGLLLNGLIALCSAICYWTAAPNH